MRQAVLTSNWDNRRRDMTYKVSIDGTGKYLLFTAETLQHLRKQIDEAMKANHARTG